MKLGQKIDITNNQSKGYIMSEMTPGVAEKEGALPGTVLSPNADTNQMFEGDETTGMEQFGTELSRPDADPSPKPSVDAKDNQRFEYWQGEAQKKDAEIERLKHEVAERAKMDPLLNVIKSDDETFNYVKSKLNAPRTPATPVEAPQKPSDYNEAEAFSNPESSSWKYRKSEEQYKDKLLRDAVQMSSTLLAEREEMKARAQQEFAQREAMKKFHNEAVSKGIADEDFEKFFQLVNSATTDDMVEYFNFKTGKASVPSQPKRSASLEGPGNPAPRRDTADIGNEMLALSRRL
jgi:hypothetical protein